MSTTLPRQTFTLLILFPSHINARIETRGQGLFQIPPYVVTSVFILSPSLIRTVSGPVFRNPVPETPVKRSDFTVRRKTPIIAQIARILNYIALK